MISCSLSPDEIVVGEVTAVSLILHNQSNRDCISLSARVKFPREVGFLTGKRQFKIDVLEANQHKTIPFKLKGKVFGSYLVGFHSFRYRDGYGDIQSLADTKLNVKVFADGASPKKIDEVDSVSKYSPHKIRKILLAEMPSRFSIEELRTLCSILDIKHEEVGGAELTPFVRNLIDYCARHEKLESLVEVVLEERPFLKNKLLP
ncbi:MAG: hypothetical protein DWQ04_27525 [Chloroflexi bacterium]|nr:MAG: hypothetical protein DWQ04_27525 [Chloroflexota bacterium]